ncbi:capsular biosynthesis protein [Acinetobacter faecalis]|uniref:capsular biosynthesis protein n=1 Tax=Acinetobacter faecalis TaxID=2665161 RepID=UPI002A9191CF|nr:capsular biosynthesis protein [Acinetobacter faecalis]MDY6510367.1 capsular biosynthesis protein [Acinetobacter faecalis]
MSQHIERLLTSKRVLLLQGPMGDFFQRFANWLTDKNIECYKINFNAGDRYFYRSMKNVFDYKGQPNIFSEWLKDFVVKHKIDAMVCFGDCREYHQQAKSVARYFEIKFFAFEEGYIRPNYITFEQDGVNFFSHFLIHFQQQNQKSNHVKLNSTLYDVQHDHKKLFRSIFIYYLVWVIFAFQYPYYRHHRGIRPVKELYYYLLSGLRLLKNKYMEPKSFDNFIKNYSKKYFVFALQVHNDFQIREHSDLKEVEQYIELVLKNFSQYADYTTHLVLKHHPMDRGYRNYKKLIVNRAKELNIEGRIHYFCDIHLPTLLKHSLGLVTVNSTTGIQSLFHKIPVAVLGRAIYNLPKLTYQYPLSNFWINPGIVDYEYFQFFKKELILYSQLNGSYYGVSPWKNVYILEKTEPRVERELI